MKTYLTLFFSLSILSAFGNSLQPFWQEHFNSGGIPASWTTGDDSNQGLAWESCENFNVCISANIQKDWCTDIDFRSSSFQDGFMFVKSINFPPLPSPSQSYLRTSTIDCSQKDKVYIRFQTFIQFSTTNPSTNALLRVRPGNGNWVEFPIFPNLSYNQADIFSSLNPQPVLLDITSVAANQSGVEIEWRWKNHNDVVWIIDNIALFDQNPQEENVVWGLSPISGGKFIGGIGDWSVVNYGSAYDSCSWVWVNTNKIDNPDEGNKANSLACWAGVSDGAMLFNASFCSASESGGNLSKADLRSPAINLSQIQPGTKLLLKFNQIASVANPADAILPITSVSVSINNGFSYIETLDANALLPYRHKACNEVELPLPNAVAGKPQVRLAFTFSGDTDFWMIDDIRITTLPDYDLAINPGFYNVPRDFSVPSNQVRPLDLYAQFRNAGQMTLTNVRARVEIRDSENEILHTDSIALGSLDPSEDWTDAHFPLKFNPSPQTETYTIFYNVSSDDEDENFENDQVHARYHVTEGTFAKNDFCISGAGYFYPTNSITYSVGNCYYVPFGSKLAAKSMSFSFDNSQNLSSAELGIRLYKWATDDTFGDVNHDTIANSNEIELVAFNGYQVIGDEYGEIVTVPISAESDKVPLEDGNYYFVTVGYADPVAIDNEIQRFPIACSEEIDYTATFYNSLESIPAYTSMLNEGTQSTSDFRANAWALKRIPFVNLNVEQISTSVKNVSENEPIQVFPNPADHSINLLLELTSSGHSIQVEFFDICGRNVLSKSIETGIVSQLAIDVSTLSNGTYTMGVILGENIFTQKIVIIH